jgi:hypothetical protein
MSTSEHLTICLNLRRTGPTQYSNFNFNSFGNLGGMVLGANEDGIFLLDSADNDDGTPIDAFLELLTSDFGIPNAKRMRIIDIGYEADGQIKVVLKADDRFEYVLYLAPAATNRQQDRGRAKGQRNVKGRYWTARIENTDGCDFSIDHIQIIPIILSGGR